MIIQGTRAFESINVLSDHKDWDKPHDYEDDLESFFWVVAFVVLSMQKPHVPWNRNSLLLSEWQDRNERVAHDAKLDFLQGPIPKDYLSGWWSKGDVIWNLLEKLREILCTKYDDLKSKADKKAREARRQRFATNKPLNTEATRRDTDINKEDPEIDEDDPRSMYTAEVKEALKLQRESDDFKNSYEGMISAFDRAIVASVQFDADDTSSHLPSSAT